MEHPSEYIAGADVTGKIGQLKHILLKVSFLGWYQGERMRDGAVGWFPSNYTQEISSAHIRAKNKKERYRLLALSDNFIQQNKLNAST